MSHHTFQLLTRHQQIDAALRREQQRPGADVLRLTRLKRLKLALKDRLARLMTR